MQWTWTVDKQTGGKAYESSDKRFFIREEPSSAHLFQSGWILFNTECGIMLWFPSLDKAKERAQLEMDIPF